MTQLIYPRGGIDPAPFGSLLSEKQALWAVDQQSRLQRFGAKAVMFPVGNPLHEAADFTNVRGIGGLAQWGTAPVGTYAPGARTTWTNPLTYVGPNGGVPKLGPFDGSTNWIEFPDDVIWNDDIAGGAHEPIYTWIIWLDIVAGASSQSVWTKSPILSESGTDWVLFLSGTEAVFLRVVDDDKAAFIGRATASGLLEGLNCIAITKSDDNASGTPTELSSDIIIYVNGVAVSVNDSKIGTYLEQEDGSTVVRIGAESDGGNPLTSSVLGASCSPLFVPGVVATADQLLEDFAHTRVLAGV